MTTRSISQGSRLECLCSLVATMLRKLRRSTKESSDDNSPALREREDSAIVMSINPDKERHTTPTPSPSGRLQFLDLPAELRNCIYEFVICDATLSLPTSGSISRKSKLLMRRRKQTETPLNGLLLTNRQLRREYLSMLLSTASVVVEVKDFDFEHVARVSSALAYADMKALQSNPNLVLHLVTQNCTAKDLAQLRRWLDFRKGNDTNLPWNYEFPLDRLLPATTMGRIRLLRELEYYADSIATLVVDLEEGQRAEIKRVIEAFESKAMWLEDDLGWLGQRSKSITRSVRGLAGGGLR